MKFYLLGDIFILHGPTVYFMVTLATRFGLQIEKNAIIFIRK